MFVSFQNLILVMDTHRFPGQILMFPLLVFTLMLTLPHASHIEGTYGSYMDEYLGDIT